MSCGSPTAYLLWAILASMFLTFLLGHLWAYDRFNCLRWDAGRQPGAFRRLMTYSYLITVPLLVFFSVTMTVLKFKEGFFHTSTGQIIPKPVIFWAPNNKDWLLPLYFIFSIAWSLELVTHLEELAFWFFLLHQGPGKHDWFHSWEFRMWYLGSVVAVLGMPLTALASRRDLELTQAWIFLAGSSAGTSTTVCFLYVLARFPRFLQHVKGEGANSDVVVRLTIFYQLNKARVIFRFFYTIPLLIIAIDVIRGTDCVVRSSFALDFLLMLGGIGCFISSSITLVIFFPRPITYEYSYTTEDVSLYDLAREPSGMAPYTSCYHSRNLSAPKPSYPLKDAAGAHLRSFRFPINRPIADSVYPLESQARHSTESQISPGYESDTESITIPFPPVPSSRQMILTRYLAAQTGATSGERSDDTVWKEREEPSVLPRRRLSDGPLFSRPRKVGITILGGIPAGAGGRSSDLEQEPATSSRLHPYVMNFTSPIDLLDQPLQERLHAGRRTKQNSHTEEVNDLPRQNK